jgi:outer membrane protein OmpA-like peptidoglycan-associated protein
VSREALAQRAHHFEFGGSGTVTHYDRLMHLATRPGAGAHVGYFLTEALSLEIDGGVTQPPTGIPLVFTTVRWVGASLALNAAVGSHNAPYLLGGYTRIDYGADPPYDFGDHAVHGAVGDRVFLIPGVALRVEGRAVFAPRTDARFGGRWAGHVIASFGVTMFPGTRHQAAPARPAVLPAPGVPEGSDRCARPQPGGVADARGCAVDRPPAGVGDSPDHCPGAAGCPAAADGDGDGVPDDADRCPSSGARTPVDSLGCLPLFTDRPVFMLRGVTFETGGLGLSAGARSVLDAVAASLVAHPELRVEVAGYTDDAGSPAANLPLSRLRADVVRTYLLSRGVASSRVTSRGFGSAAPIASNTTAAGRAQNRRVELHRLP